MNHPKCGPKSGLAHNTSAYLKFGLPRVVTRPGREESSGYDSSNDGSPVMRSKNLLLSRSDPDFRKHVIHHPNGSSGLEGPAGPNGHQGKGYKDQRRLRSSSEANLLSGMFCDMPSFSLNEEKNPIKSCARHKPCIERFLLNVDFMPLYSFESWV